MRRALTIVAGLIVLLGIGVAVYFIFFASNAPHLTVSNGTPFNSSTGTRTVSTTTNSIEVSGNAGTLVAPGLVQITNSPVSSGAGVFDVIIPGTATTSVATTSATSTTAALGTPDVAVRYIDRASGNIYQYLANARSLTRIASKTLPGIQHASWTQDGSLAFVQFLSNTSGSEHVETYALPATGDNGYFLQQDLAEAQVLGSNTLFTLALGSNSSIGTTAHTDGTNPATLFTSPLTSIRVQSLGSGFMAIPQASNSLTGYIFSINSSGVFTPILGPLRGLTALASPSGSQILYSYTDGAQFHMNVYDRTTGNVINLPLATLAEKCVWTPDSSSVYCAIPTGMSGTLPDDWYQGAVSFNDRIWQINIQTHLASLVLDPSATAHTSIDAVDLTLDPKAQVLVFRNKNDSSLWAYKL